MKRKELFIFALLLVLCVPWLHGQSDTDPLCFTAKNGVVKVRFDIKRGMHAIVYSTDASTWNDYSSGTEITLGENQKVYFRAKENQTTIHVCLLI